MQDSRIVNFLWVIKGNNMLQFTYIFTACFIISLIFLLIRKKFTIFHKDFITTEAKILTVELTGVCIKEEMQAIIQLQVLPDLGKSFVCEIQDMLNVSDYIHIQPGKKIQVIYAPRKIKELKIIKTAWRKTK